MGNTVYWMNVSMDLRIEHAPGEQGGGSWMRIGEQLHRAFNERAQQLKLGFEGRVIYETMESFWPKAASDSTLPDYLQEYGRIWTATPKVLVSNTRREAGYNTRIVGGPDAMAQLATLRRETDGAIGVGGATLATALLQHGLLDEVLLFIHPVILGSGRPLFDDGSAVIGCELLEQATFEGGVVMHRYAVNR
jgi:dihydrofolate reductase